MTKQQLVEIAERAGDLATSTHLELIVTLASHCKTADELVYEVNDRGVGHVIAEILIREFSCLCRGLPHYGSVN